MYEGSACLKALMRPCWYSMGMLMDGASLFIESAACTQGNKHHELQRHQKKSESVVRGALQAPISSSYSKGELCG